MLKISNTFKESKNFICIYVENTFYQKYKTTLYVIILKTVKIMNDLRLANLSFDETEYISIGFIVMTNLSKAVIIKLLLF